MKTIFNKIDPQYLECTSGACEHVSHQFNAMWWLVIFGVAGYLIYRKLKILENIGIECFGWFFRPSDPHHRIERAKTPHLHKISDNNIGFSMRFDVNFVFDPRKWRKFDLQKIPGVSSN